jgi:hypothetical protein
MKSFRAEEYDAGASLTYQASQRAEAKEYSWTSQSILNFDFTLVLLRRRLLKAFKASAFVI